MESIPVAIKRLLDESQMMGKLSLHLITQAIKDDPWMCTMANDIMLLKRILEEGLPAAAGDAKRIPTHNLQLIQEYKHSDGWYRRVPPSWTSPKLALQNMYLYWYCGDEEKYIPPIICFEKKDVDFLCKRVRRNLTECRKVVVVIDRAAKSQGEEPKQMMNRLEANACYAAGEPAILVIVSSTTKYNRSRVVAWLAWGMIVKHLWKSNNNAYIYIYLPF